jgi:hypothetical protein
LKRAIAATKKSDSFSDGAMNRSILVPAMQSRYGKDITRSEILGIAEIVPGKGIFSREGSSDAGVTIFCGAFSFRRDQTIIQIDMIKSGFIPGDNDIQGFYRSDPPHYSLLRYSGKLTMSQYYHLQIMLL